MTQTLKKFEMILRLISEHQFSNANSEIEEWISSENITQQDFENIEYLKGLILIHQGQLNNAVICFKKIESKTGAQLRTTMELACCYYQLSLWPQWRQCYRKIEFWLTENNNDTSIAKTQILEAYLLLGKFYEEEGCINKACELYSNALELVFEGNDQLSLKIKTQTLRVEASFGSKENIGKTYSELIQIQEENKTRDFSIEFEHALMLAELNLVGPQHASERLLRVLNMENILLADKSLILYDYLEECIINKYGIPEIVSNWCTKISPSDEFEKIIETLVFLKTSELTLNHLMQLSSKVSPASHLRLLILGLKALPKYSSEIKNKLHLLLSALDSPSRHLWNKRIDAFTESSSKLLKFDFEKRMISFESKDIDLSRKRGMLVFAEKIAQKGDISVEDMIEEIWQSDYSPDHFHRLRMTAHRMNQLLFDLTSIEKPIEVSSDRIKLNPKIKFQCIRSVKRLGLSQ